MERNRFYNPRRSSSSLSSSSSSSYTSYYSKRNSLPDRSSYDQTQSRKDPVSSGRGPRSPPKSGDSCKPNPRGEVPSQELLEEDSTEAPSLIGTCPFMCPVREMTQRERLRDLAFFERLHGNPAKTSPDIAVKKFCRTITAKHVQPSDVRPLSVLESTLDFLLKLMHATGEPFEVVHDFVFDRTRSIRQDLCMQNIVDTKVISMYEKMVTFHVTSHHKLRQGLQGPSGDSDVSALHQLNLEQLGKTLTSLYNLYELNRDPDLVYENEPEFRSLYVMLNLSFGSRQKGEPLSLWLRHVPSTVIRSKEMLFARKILRYFRMGNYKRFLGTIAAEASHLQYCIIEPYIDEVRALAVSCINNCGYKLHPYPIPRLSLLLMMEESEVESFCNACGLETCTDSEGNNMLPTKQQPTFSQPKKAGFQKYSFLGLEVNT